MTVRDLTKRKALRSKKILRACHQMQGGCTVQLPGCLGPHAPTVPAHSNQSDDGKGKGQKADDIFVAQACQNCHDVLDMRTEIIPEDARQWYHDRGIKRTIRRLIDEGILKC